MVPMTLGGSVLLCSMSLRVTVGRLLKIAQQTAGAESAIYAYEGNVT